MINRRSLRGLSGGRYIDIGSRMAISGFSTIDLTANKVAQRQ
jgi:hypothetical protein